MDMRTQLKRLLRKYGLDLIRYNTRSSPVARQIRLFQYFQIDLVFDVGANTGGFVHELRKTGYEGRIVSFEPLSEAFAQLEIEASRDAYWDVVHTGLGRSTEQKTIHVAKNSESSSFLEMSNRHAKTFPQSIFIGSEVVAVDRLDSVFSEYYRDDDHVFLKIDTQGYEQHVLDGGSDSLDNILGIQVEMSLVPLYEGESRLVELVSFLEDRGYQLMSLAPVIDDPSTGQLLQVDGLFFRPDWPEAYGFSSDT